MNLSHPTCTKEWYIECEPTYSWNWTCDLVYKIHSIFHAYKHVSYTSNEYWCFPSIWTDDLAFDLTWLSFDQDLESTKIIILWKTVECFAVQGQLLHNPWWNLAVFPKILRSYCDVVCTCCLDQKLNVMSIVFSR